MPADVGEDRAALRSSRPQTQATDPDRDRFASAFRGTNVLVTGASGFLGGHLVRRLHAMEAVVIPTSRRRGVRIAGVDATVVELGDGSAVGDLVRQVQPTAIFHMSGLARVTGRLDDVWPSFESLAVSTVRILEAVAAHSPATTVFLPGSMEEPLWGEAPASPYSAAKLASTAYGQMFRTCFGLRVAIGRLFMSYGPGQPRGKLIPSMIRDALAARPITVRNPDRVVDFAYVDDVVTGLLEVAARCPAEIIDLGSGRARTIGQVADIVARLAGVTGERVVTTGSAGPTGAEPERLADSARALAVIGWQPTIDLEEGLTRTIDWIRRTEDPG